MVALDCIQLTLRVSNLAYEPVTNKNILFYILIITCLMVLWK